MSLPERPALPARAHAGGHAQPLRLTAVAPLQRFRCPSNFPPHRQGGETPGHLPGSKVPSSIRSPCPCFPRRAPVAEGGHTSLLGASAPWGSWAVHNCRHAEMGTISFGYKARRNSMDYLKQYQIETGVLFGVSNEYSFIKHARPNKHKKEITKALPYRKHTRVLPRLELAGK